MSCIRNAQEKSGRVGMLRPAKLGRSGATSYKFFGRGQVIKRLRNDFNAGGAEDSTFVGFLDEGDDSKVFRIGVGLQF